MACHSFYFLSVVVQGPLMHPGLFGDGDALDAGRLHGQGAEIH